MPDSLAVITRAVLEHHAIMEHVKLAGDTVNDIEALLTLQREHAGWTQSSIAALAEKQNRMQQAISFLEQGLKNHFAFEEDALIPMFGELLAKAILHEHHEISRQIESAKTILSNIKLEGLEQRELLSQKSEIQRTIDHLCQAVEEHAHHEEVIINMMKKTLEGNES
ncbi:hemerythrin domain-containing protein [Chloroflexota bacterium]